MSERRFPTPQPITVEVTVAAGDVQVATTDDDESTVMLDGPPKLTETIRVELVGDRLVVQQRRRSGLGIFERFDGPLSVRVTTPHGSRAVVATASADATLEGTFGGVQMKSASGSMLVTGRIDGDASVETVSGNARLPQVGGAVTARSVSGDLAVESVDGAVSVKSVSGDVAVGSVREGTATVQSVSGGVDLGIAAGTRIEIDAASASGALTSEIPLSDAPGDETGPKLVIRGRTVSGAFRVFRAA